ncbi:MAG: hypothetical protein AAFZ15_26440, partial [Bacteroidota bacterium]
MYQNLLIKTLSALPRKKITRFKEFAHSPYFNKHKDTLKLINYLVGVYPDFPEKKCQREIIYNHLFPNSPHDQKKLAILFSYAMRLLEQFFRIEESVRSGVKEDVVLLARHLRNLDLMFLLKIKWKEIYKGVNKNNNIDLSQNPMPAIEALNELDKSAYALQNYTNDYLAGKQTLLDRYYLVEKLKDACEMVQRKNLFKQPYIPSNILQHNIEWLDKNRDNNNGHPSIYLFLDLYKLITENNEELYFYLKEEIVN